MSDIAVTNIHEKIAPTTTLTSEQVAIVSNTVAKGTSPLELAYFLNVCESVGLNPFLKEIWCYKDNKNNLLIFTGRDGFLKKAQENPYFNGIRSSEIRENDEFSIDIANNEIRHAITKWDDERGPIKGAYAIVFRKNGEPTITIADFKRYNKGYNTWKTHPEAMIKKVAETNALKLAFGISGLQSEHEFVVQNGVVTPIGSGPKDFLGEVAMLRGDDRELSHEEFLKKVSYNEINKPNPESNGEIKHIRNILESNKYDLETGEVIEQV